MAEKGWIKLHRQLQECPIWYGERFSKGQAWVDLLLLANHSDKKIIFNGEMITIKRGQYLTSTVKLAEKWGWNRKTVSSYLNMLQKENMITKVSDNLKTLVTIENYENFQGLDENDGQPIGQVNGQLNGQRWDNPTDNPLDNSTDSRTDTNKNVKNDNNDKNEKNVKNDKNIYPPISPQGEEELEKPKRNKFVPPTYEEVDAYCVERNNDIDAQEFIDFYQSKGWMVGKNKMKDWKAAIRTWERGRQKKATDKPKRQGVKWE